MGVPDVVLPDAKSLFHTLHINVTHSDAVDKQLLLYSQLLDMSYSAI